MVCSACQDKPVGKPCGTCGKLPPVLQINSEECPVIFHTVELEGTIEDNPPAVGRYRNVMTQYKGDGYKVLYSSDGIPSNLGNGESTKDFNALNNRPKYDGKVMTSETDIPNPTTVATALVAAEATARTNADRNLSDRINDESTARQSADATLSSRIDATDTNLSAERAARIAADNSLSSSLSSEATARASADTALGNRITAVSNSIGDGTITFTENNVVKGTFSANSTENKTIEFPVPTQTSELTNNGSDGTSTYVEAKDMPTVDTAYSRTSNNAIANSTVTNSLDRGVLTDLALDTNPSTTTVNLNNTKTNLATPSSTTTTALPLPIASSTQAGIMNAAMYDALTKNTQDIANIMGEVVAITGLPANPTQAELTTAWLNASGEPALINGAGIYDVTNAKRWTYYSNDTTWHALDASGSVTVNPWSNTAAGIVKGSTSVGQIFAENDGTGSVNGWDTLSNTVADHTSKLATIAQGAEVNVQSNWTETDTASDAYIQNKPQNLVSDAAYVHTDNNFTTTLKNKLDGIEAGAQVNLPVDTALSSTSTNAVENQAIDAEFDKVAYIGDNLSTPTTVEFVSTINIQDGAVTAAKTDFILGKGVVSLPAIAASSGTQVSVSLSAPDSNYMVLITPTFDSNNQNWPNVVYATQNISSTGFLIRAYNGATSASGTGIKVQWIAIKL